MNIIKGRIVIRLLLLKFLIVFIYSCGPDPAVLIVQNGKMKVCPSKTVKQMVDEVMESQIWESFIATDGRKYVNIYGDVTSNDEIVNAWLQFLVNHEPLIFWSKDETFKFNALEYDGETKTNLDLMELLVPTCREDARFDSEELFSSIDYVDENIHKPYRCQTLECWFREKG